MCARKGRLGACYFAPALEGIQAAPCDQYRVSASDSAASLGGYQEPSRSFIFLICIRLTALKIFAGMNGRSRQPRRGMGRGRRFKEVARRLILTADGRAKLKRADDHREAPDDRAGPCAIGSCSFCRCVAHDDHQLCQADTLGSLEFYASGQDKIWLVGNVMNRACWQRFSFHAATWLASVSNAGSLLCRRTCRRSSIP